MKTKFKFIASTVSCLLLFAVSAISTPASAALYQLSGDMDVFQALTNPDNIGSGTGTISGDYNDVTNILNYSLEWSGLTSDVNNIHFHLGAPGVSGGIQLGVPGPWSSPQIGSGIVLTAAQETNLLAGNWYVNVHTDDFAGGEIRGQVNVSAVPVPAAFWLFGSAVVAVMGLRARRTNISQ